MVSILPASPENIVFAAKRLQNDGVVAFATETVYGLGVNSHSDVAVAQIYSIKKRPSFNPLVIHVCDVQMAERYAILSDNDRLLIEAFWPCQLTLVVPAKLPSKISKLALAGLASVAIRMPENASACELIKTAGFAIAAPSANISGSPSPTKAEHVKNQFENQDIIIIDDGPCRYGIESTIVAIRGERFAILRPGLITAEHICAKTPLKPRKYNRAEKRRCLTTPGQLINHYSPTAKVRINAVDWQKDEIWLAFGEPPKQVPKENIIWLSENRSMQEAAARLFDCLHQCDKNKVKKIAIAPIPKHGIGIAINDRITKAAKIDDER